MAQKLSKNLAHGAQREVSANLSRYIRTADAKTPLGANPDGRATKKQAVPASKPLYKLKPFSTRRTFFHAISCYIKNPRFSFEIEDFLFTFLSVR